MAQNVGDIKTNVPSDSHTSVADTVCEVLESSLKRLAHRRKLPGNK